MGQDVIVSDAARQPEPLMAVGDPTRPAIRRAVFRSMVTAAVFFLLTGPVKQIKPLYNHAPWLNDPFDTVVSFMMFFVPFVTFLCAVRVWLCRTHEPLPLGRVRDILRACRVVLAAIAITALSEWISIAIGENRSQWDAATALQVAFLVIISLLAGRAFFALHRLGGASGVAMPSVGDASDWFDDAVVVARSEIRWLGPLRGLGLRLLAWLEREPLAAVRAHPVRVASLLCVAFGTVVGVNQGVAEGYDASSMLVAASLLACGMFALVVGTGGYLGLVRGVWRLQGARRRALDATVVTCFGVIVAFAFRYHLWWVAGSTNAVAGNRQLLAILATFAGPIFGATFVFETITGRHAASRDGAGEN